MGTIIGGLSIAAHGVQSTPLVMLAFAGAALMMMFIKSKLASPDLGSDIQKGR